ncbi:MAG: hypothetical protein WDN28_18345 [Chthoniobacter sp.]
MGRTRDEEADGRPQDADGEHRLAPDAIGEMAEDRGKDQLEQRINAHEQAELGGRGAEARALGIHRQHGNHDPEADHVDQDGEEDEPQR